MWDTYYELRLGIIQVNLASALALHRNCKLLKQEIYLWKSLFRNIFPPKDFLPRFLFENIKSEGDVGLHITGDGSAY